MVKTFGCIASKKTPLAFHESGKYMAFITSLHLKIYIKDTDEIKTLKPFKMIKNTKEELSSVAFHPMLHTIATGTKSGMIFLWHNWRKEESLTIKLHWHHTTVNDLLFTSDGMSDCFTNLWYITLSQMYVDP